MKRNYLSLFFQHQMIHFKYSSWSLMILITCLSVLELVEKAFVWEFNVKLTSNNNNAANLLAQNPVNHAATNIITLSRNILVKHWWWVHQSENLQHTCLCEWWGSCDVPQHVEHHVLLVPPVGKLKTPVVTLLDHYNIFGAL